MHSARTFDFNESDGRSVDRGESDPTITRQYYEGVDVEEGEHGDGHHGDPNNYHPGGGGGGGGSGHYGDVDDEDENGETGSGGTKHGGRKCSCSKVCPCLSGCGNCCTRMGKCRLFFIVLTVILLGLTATYVALKLTDNDILPTALGGSGPTPPPPTPSPVAPPSGDGSGSQPSQGESTLAVGDQVCGDGYIMDNASIDAGVLQDPETMEGRNIPALEGDGPAMHTFMGLLNQESSGYSLLERHPDLSNVGHRVKWKFGDDRDSRQMVAAEARRAGNCVDDRCGDQPDVTGFWSNVCGRVASLPSGDTPIVLDVTTVQNGVARPPGSEPAPAPPAGPPGSEPAPAPPAGPPEGPPSDARPGEKPGDDTPPVATEPPAADPVTDRYQAIGADVAASAAASLPDVVDPASYAERLANTSTPQHKALAWLVEEDPRQVTPGEPELTQRFALATMFYAVAGAEGGEGDASDEMSDGGWMTGAHECDWDFVNCKTRDEVNMGGDEGGDDGGDGSNSTEGGEGDGRVPKPNTTLGGEGGDDREPKPNSSVEGEGGDGRKLKPGERRNRALQDTPDPFETYDEEMAGQEMAGYNFENETMPQEPIPVISSAPGGEDMVSTTGGQDNWAAGGVVVGLNLTGMNLVGELPQEILSLVYLEDLDVSHNNLTGPIPEGLGTLKHLKVLKLNNNDFVGNIPASIGSLTMLGELRLEYNSLSGEVPETICALDVPGFGQDFEESLPNVQCTCCETDDEGGDTSGNETAEEPSEPSDPNEIPGSDDNSTSIGDNSTSSEGENLTPTDDNVTSTENSTSTGDDSGASPEPQPSNNETLTDNSTLTGDNSTLGDEGSTSDNMSNSTGNSTSTGDDSGVDPGQLPPAPVDNSTSTGGEMPVNTTVCHNDTLDLYFENDEALVDAEYNFFDAYDKACNADDAVCVVAHDNKVLSFRSLERDDKYQSFTTACADLGHEVCSVDTEYETDRGIMRLTSQPVCVPTSCATEDDMEAAVPTGLVCTDRSPEGCLLISLSSSACTMSSSNGGAASGGGGEISSNCTADIGDMRDNTALQGAEEELFRMVESSCDGATIESPSDTCGFNHHVVHLDFGQLSSDDTYAKYEEDCNMADGNFCTVSATIRVTIPPVPLAAEEDADGSTSRLEVTGYPGCFAQSCSKDDAIEFMKPFLFSEFEPADDESGRQRRRRVLSVLNENPAVKKMMRSHSHGLLRKLQDISGDAGSTASSTMDEDSGSALSDIFNTFVDTIMPGEGDEEDPVTAGLEEIIAMFGGGLSEGLAEGLEDGAFELEEICLEDNPMCTVEIEMTCGDDVQNPSEGPPSTPSPAPPSFLLSGDWNLTTTPELFGTHDGDLFGSVLSLSEGGHRLAVASRMEMEGDGDQYLCTVRVYSNERGLFWEPLGTDIVEDIPLVDLRCSVSLSRDGRRVAVGAVGEGVVVYGLGQVKVYQYQQTDEEWSMLGSILGDTEGPREQFGYAVSMSEDGGTVAVGAPMAGEGTGSVAVFTYDEDDGDWQPVGAVIEGEADSSDGRFGSSVALSAGASVVVGGAPKGGYVAAHKLDEPGDAWSPLGRKISSDEENDQFGFVVAVSHNGEYIATGAPKSDNGSSSGVARGRAYVTRYDEEDKDWTFRGMPIGGENDGDQGGYSVSLSSSGDVLAVGFPGDEDLNDSTPGHTTVYQYVEGQSRDGWQGVGDDLTGKEQGDEYGAAVSVSGNGRTVAVGAPVTENLSRGYVQVYSI